ncbi:SOS response associated peptidase (SRAP) [compost metagenome]
MLGIAGLWSIWTEPEGQDVASCALLTRVAASSVATIHHRMPVILSPNQFDLWISLNTSSVHIQEVIAHSREDFIARAVSTDVGDNRNDYPELLEPIELSGC